MATDVTMPRLSDSMEEGTVLKWLVEEGGEVKRGEPLVEIETDKANMTYEADTDGTLIEIIAQEGDTLAIGEAIARVGEPSEANGDGKRSQQARGRGRGAEDEAAGAEQAEPDEDGEREEVAAEAAARARPAARPAPETAAGRRSRAPRRASARRAATEAASRPRRSRAGWHGSSASSSLGSRAAAPAVASSRPTCRPPPKAAPRRAPATRSPRTRPPRRPQPAPEPQRGEAGAKGAAEIQELTRLQQTVSRRMAESKATAPDFSISLTVDMTQAVELRTRLKQVAEPAPSYNDMVVKAAATALREHPRVNGAYRDGKFELYEKVNIGVAVAAQDALVVPTVFDADRKSLGQIARDARAAAEKVRERTITPPELSGATFTVSNLGMFGIEQFTAIINPPQAAILTVGKLDKRPAVDEGGRIVARDQMSLSLVCDHRILYGADGAQFLARVKELLEQPLALALVSPLRTVIHPRRTGS